MSNDLPGRAIFFIFIFCMLLSFYPARLSCQESILSSYERNFIRASLAEKPWVLRDAALDEKSGDFIGALSETALQFALANSRSLRNDPDMITLVAAAARGAGTGGNKASSKTLWELFRVFQDSYSRVEILGALAALGKGDAEVIGNLNRFLEESNNSFRREGVQDFPVVRACVAALGVLGDSSSFPILFSAMTASYPQTVAQEILKALESIEGDFKDYLISVIRRNPLHEKAAAFRLGAYNEKLKAAERGELALAALEVSLNPSVAGSGPMAASLRYDAITVLTRLQWSPASHLAVRNFYQVQRDYMSGAASRDRFLEAITCLGVMETSEAAQALALLLGYFNSLTEQLGEYDEAVILALINALGELGDKAAFDYLLYIGYLNYPDKIQASAREALNRLKW